MVSKYPDQLRDRGCGSQGSCTVRGYMFHRMRETIVIAASLAMIGVDSKYVFDWWESGMAFVGSDPESLYGTSFHIPLETREIASVISEKAILNRGI